MRTGPEGIEAWWEVRVEPEGGTGYLTEWDVERACHRLPDGACVWLVLSEMEDFAPAAVGLLARRLAAVTVRFLVSDSARGCGADFVATFVRAQAHYVAVEANLLRGRPA